MWRSPSSRAAATRPRPGPPSSHACNSVPGPLALQIRRHARRPIRPNDRLLSPLPELGVPEDDLMLTGRDGQIANGGVAHRRAIHPNRGPRRGIDVERAVWHVDGQRRDLTRFDLNAFPYPITDGRVDEFEFVPAGGGENRAVAAGSEHSFAVEDVELDGGRQAEPAAFGSRDGKPRVLS